MELYIFKWDVSKCIDIHFDTSHLEINRKSIDFPTNF